MVRCTRPGGLGRLRFRLARGRNAGSPRRGGGPAQDSARSPALGYVLWDAYPKPWGDIKTEQQLDDDVAAAAQAVTLANQMNIAEYKQEPS